MGEGNQKLKKEGDEVRISVAPVRSLLRGGVGTRPPRSSNRSGGRAGDWGRPTASTRAGPAPCLRRRDSECMKTTWWARRTGATAAPPHLPPLKEGTGVSPPRRRD